eukprot:scpid62027/ scgid4597/ CDP-diacylglycerol--glycerol-3-phosphate 3-phosphatidyltransferase, mitochondrial; Phosphatidylglycerophosphate synthase 1
MALSRLVRVVPSSCCRCCSSSLNSPAMSTGHQPSSGSTTKSGDYEFLSNHAPGFPVDGNTVEVLREPIDFYRTVQNGVRSAKKRVVLASLYLGTGEREQALVDSLAENLTSNPNLRSLVLVDGCRGSRGSANTRTMLAPLLNTANARPPVQTKSTVAEPSCAERACSAASRLHVALYQTPELPNWIRWLVPHKYNEVPSLQHMKIYIFDNDVMLSGANLSADYFHQRQDRFVLIRDAPRLADYLTSVVATVATHSYSLRGDNVLEFSGKTRQRLMAMLGEVCAGSNPSPTDCDALPDPLVAGNRQKFYASLRAALKALRTSAQGDTSFFGVSQPEHSTASSNSDALGNARTGADQATRLDNPAVQQPDDDTILYPLLQLGPAGIQDDETATRRLLEQSRSRGYGLRLASGYFNLTPEYSKSLLERGQDQTGFTEILLASPQANGFLGARGPRGSIPAGYVHRCKLFYQAVCQSGCKDTVHLAEYFRNGWTFHGKGLWLYPVNSDTPDMTMVGSPNFGYRSTCRDVELQVAMVTKNASLRRKLKQEADYLFSFGQSVDESTFQRPDHRVPWLVAVIANVVRKFV